MRLEEMPPRIHLVKLATLTVKVPDLGNKQALEALHHGTSHANKQHHGNNVANQLHPLGRVVVLKMDMVAVGMVVKITIKAAVVLDGDRMEATMLRPATMLKLAGSKTTKAMVYLLHLLLPISLHHLHLAASHLHHHLQHEVLR